MLLAVITTNLLLRLTLIISTVLITDLVFYRILKKAFFAGRAPLWFLFLYLGHILAFLAAEILVVLLYSPPLDNPVLYRKMFGLLSIFLFFYFPKISSIILAGPLLLGNYFCKRLRKKAPGVILPRVALIVWGLALGYLIYSFTVNKTNLRIRKIDATWSCLPESFVGYRILQFSDLHLGSYADTTYVMNLIREMQNLEPDLIVFTGDMINNSDSEVDPYLSAFSGLRAPGGKFAVTGNHDLGDYFRMSDVPGQSAIVARYRAKMKQAGFVILSDSAVFISRGTDSIRLAGVENCGTFPFECRGDAGRALSGTPDHCFTIMLSHDPDYWKNSLRQNPRIQLTLSGHTHAMQMAFEAGPIKLSPAWFKYRYWYGLYREGESILYVNPGSGYSGFAGRIGLRPEITIITLGR